MKRIQSPIDTIGKIAGEQRFFPEKGYRKSFFCLEVPCQDGTLLYNTLTGELLLFDGLDQDAWAENSSLHEQLVRRWFLVPQDFDEVRHCEQVRSVARLMQREKKEITHYIVFTTTDCNARCFYCFEKGQRRFSMSEQTAADVAAYMLRKANGRKITFQWFGGEPLYNSRAIDIICELLRNNGAEYESKLVSNAYLFDSEMIKKAKELWKLRHVLVTIDGTEETYNRTKAYIYRDGSAYQRVLSNIDMLLDHRIDITVNLNMDAANAQIQFDLADELGLRYAGKNGFNARAGLLREFVGKINHFDSPEQALAMNKALNNRLESFGIREKKRLKHTLTLNSCMADDSGTEVIQPDGHIGRCEHFGDSEYVGSIYSDTYDNDKLLSWKERLPVEDNCKTCAAYPQCMRLKKCNSCPDPCDELFRGLRIMSLQDQMRNTYEKWKREQLTKLGGTVDET